MKIKWTDEMLLEEARKYDTRMQFQEKSSSAYNTTRSRGLLEMACAHMPKYTKRGRENPRFRWTDEMLLEEARKYSGRQDFRNGSYAAYLACKRRNILDDVCKHMSSRYHYWTDDEIAEVALKYESRVEFETENLSAYQAATYRKILDLVCKHMKLHIFSRFESELSDLIKMAYPNTCKLRDRNVKIPYRPYVERFEIDIYVPELRRGIEFDGKYYHSTAKLISSRKHWPVSAAKNYHAIKDAYFKSKGIDILHIKEEDWITNKESCVEKCLLFLKGDTHV